MNSNTPLCVILQARSTHRSNALRGSVVPVVAAASVEEQASTVGYLAQLVVSLVAISIRLARCTGSLWVSISLSLPIFLRPVDPVWKPVAVLPTRQTHMLEDIESWRFTP